MGFWSSFLGHAAAEVARDMKQQERETQRWNDLFHELGQYETAFNNYLSSVGIQDVYIADVEYVNSGNIMPAKREMDAIKRKIEKFISLGGQGKHLYRLEDIDEAIEVIKYLKDKDCLHRQHEFLSLGLLLTQSTLEREIREDRGIQILIDSPNNELAGSISEGDYRFVEYDDILDDSEVIKIDTAQVYDEDIIEFLQFKTVSAKFSKEKICVYNYQEHNQMYYKTTIGENQKVEVSSIPIPAVQGWSLLVVNGLQIMCSTELVGKVSEIYMTHNFSVIEEENTLSALAAENINNLSGVEFERVCQLLVENMGFSVETTKASGDGGIDLIAYNSQPLLSGKYIIQCKRYTGSVGEPIIRDLYGVVMSERANKGILMTTGHFTKSAKSFAEGKPIELIDGVAMQNLFSQYGLLSPLSKNKATGTMNLSKSINLQEMFVPILEDDRCDCIMELNEACTYEYHILKEQLESEEYNYSVRSRMIDMMFHVYLTDNRLSCQLAMKQHLYKRCLAQLLREEIAWFYENANSAEIKIQTLKDFYYIYLADIELTQGNMYNAFELYGKALYSKTLEKDRIVCECANDKDDVVGIIFDGVLPRIVMNMCQILAVMNLKECAERLKNKYRYLIDYHIYIATLTYNQHPDNYWARIEYEWYSNSCSPYAFRLTNYEEYFDNPESNLYDDSYYNNIVVDSTLETYSELRKINIDEEDLLIDDTTCLDYQYVLQENKEKLRGLFA